MELPTAKFAQILRDFDRMGRGIKMSYDAANPLTLVLSSCDTNGQSNGNNYEVCLELAENGQSGVGTASSLVQVFAAE